MWNCSETSCPIATSSVMGRLFARHGGSGELWPEGKRKQGHPPLTLRVITVQKGTSQIRRGGQTWYLVTSLLDPDQLIEAAAGKLYTRRWGIECCFRTLKQTFERGKVRSYIPECGASELDWSLLSLWLVSLLAKQELIAAKIDPERHSAAEARRLVRHELRFQSAGRERLDISAFQTAVKDCYRRASSKKARHDQRKKRDPPPGAPQITAASKAQRQSAQAFENSRA